MDLSVRRQRAAVAERVALASSACFLSQDAGVAAETLSRNKAVGVLSGVFLVIQANLVMAEVNS